MKQENRSKTVRWPELVLVMENAEMAAHRQVSTARKGGECAERDLWDIADRAAVESAREVLGDRELSQPQMRLVLDAAEVANLAVK